MIYGIGIDCASIARVAKSIKRKAFINRCFGAQEQALYVQRGEHAQTLAAAFAAKEALVKALGVGLFTYDMRCMELLRHDSGKPYFALGGDIAQLVKAQKLNVHVSVTHEAELATAIVILESMQ